MDRAAFYASVRARASGVFGTSLSQSQVQGTEALLNEAEKRGTALKHVAYILATAYHETAHTMQPIAEYGKGKGRAYGNPGKYGQAQYGRGYVQLTWDRNYELADKKLGLNGALLKNFDLALKPDIAAAILFVGMDEGWFTSKKNSDYINDAKTDYVNARRIVNGTDKADLIAGYAKAFEAALVAAGYGKAPAAKPVETVILPDPPKADPIPESTPAPAPVQPEPAKIEPQPVDDGNWLAKLLTAIWQSFQGKK